MALEVVDGGFMEDVIISDLTMEDVQTPIFIRLGRRKASENSYLKDVLIKNITASSASYVASSITGVPGLRVDNVEIRDVNFKLKGGGKVSDTLVEVPEVEKAYMRHADNIRLVNVKLSTVGDKEERHAVVAEDVNGLEITDSALQSPDSELSVVRLKDCRNVNLPKELQ